MRQQARQGRPIPRMSREGVAIEPEQLERAVEAERACGGRLGNEVVAQVELKQEGQMFEPLDTLFIFRTRHSGMGGSAWYVLGLRGQNRGVGKARNETSNPSAC